MKIHYASLSTALLGLVSAQQMSDPFGSSLTWIESGNAKNADGTGLPANAVLSLDDTSITVSAKEKSNDQEEIDNYVQKTNADVLYPFGPFNNDVRAPAADDAVSNNIDLPYPLPYFGGKTTSDVRISTNGLIILDDKQIYEYNPTELPSIGIDAPFVAGFWNDIYTKKQGKIFWRIDTNRPTLDELQKNILEGFPELKDAVDYRLKYALIVTYYRVTHYGSKKGNTKQNTFQMAITTDGKYSFLINNYHDIQWNIATGTSAKAVAGFDIDDQYFSMVEGSMEDASLDWNRRSTNSNQPGRHIFRLDDKQINVQPTQTPISNEPGEEIPPGVVHPENIWPSNDNTLGGGIFKYIPLQPIGNGTCTIQFPSPVAWFHVFNAHIRADSAVTSMVWKIVAANPTFEPSLDDGSFSFAVQFNRGFEFAANEITMTCNSDDEFTYAVYSFPQNHLQQSGRSNLRRRDNVWDPTASYSLTFVSPVANFTVDDPRINVATYDNMNFLLSDVPDSLEEVWFQFDYIDYFGSNEVGVVTSA